ncbi:hypothetical protein [Stratiformator vulcanicus]|uniref:Uncharacterized protein n=1 Tax=Stratiformator vulcanicus TaxID=2527980 RepID=A0A517R6Q9_9PLAN|nr:hypothetical protein [Stratiformator vulcanicus]QDT39586.1 hypothetical protein Pan189_39950 [Stratiformator vulcanicus]
MKTLWVGNFDFEHRLATQTDGLNHLLPEKLRAINRRLAPLLRPLLRPGDAIFINGPSIEGPDFIGSESELTRFSRVEFWGNNQWAEQWARARMLPFSGPLANATTLANSRLINDLLELQFGVRPDKTRVVHTMEELREAIDHAGCDRWVIKEEFSGSARQRMIGSGSRPDERIEKWAARRLGHPTKCLFFEPWLDRIAEIGMQFHLSPDGNISLVGVADLNTAEDGRYVSSRLLSDIETASWSDCIKIGRLAADELTKLGYHGPLGIDAMRYRDIDGKERFRPLQDINARWTMGRIAVEAAKR